MAHLRLPHDLREARNDLLELLRGLLVRKPAKEMLVFPGFPLDEDGVGGMTRSESQMSRVSEYLDVERSKSLNSSLKKCNRTDAEKKVVSFADAMGLDLCQIRQIFPYTTSDEDLLSSTPPKTTVPIIRSSQPRPPMPTSSFNNPRYLYLLNTPFNLFNDPLHVHKQLLSKAKSQMVTLKTSNVIGMTFSGVIAVRNVTFHKKVQVRYTVDDWRSFIDINCHYVSSNHEEQLDLFSFSIYLPPSMPVGARCHFCIRYETNGQEFWDNNGGNNYVLEVRTMASNFSDNDVFDQPVFY